MDLNEIKEIMESEGGKFIIVENGKPVMVVTSFEEYKKRIKAYCSHAVQQTNPSSKKPTVHTYNNLLPKELQEEELKIEDLPF
jgi:prevent-host-death family protein